MKKIGCVLFYVGLLVMVLLTVWIRNNGGLKKTVFYRNYYKESIESIINSNKYYIKNHSTAIEALKIAAEYEDEILYYDSIISDYYLKYKNIRNERDIKMGIIKTEESSPFVKSILMTTRGISEDDLLNTKHAIEYRRQLILFRKDRINRLYSFQDQLNEINRKKIKKRFIDIEDEKFSPEGIPKNIKPHLLFEELDDLCVDIFESDIELYLKPKSIFRRE